MSAGRIFVSQSVVLDGESDVPLGGNKMYMTLYSLQMSLNVQYGLAPLNDRPENIQFQVR